jgi:Periplasmic binding protein
MLLLIATLLALAPKPLPPKLIKSWEPLSKASALLAMGQQKNATELLSPIIKQGGELGEAAKVIFATSLICKGKVLKAKSALEGIKKQKKELFILIFKKLTATPPLPGIKQNPYINRLSLILENLNLQLCHYLGKLLVAQELYPLLKTEKEKTILENWIVDLLKRTPAIDHKLFNDIVAFRILARKKLLNFLVGGQWTLDDDERYKNFMKQKQTPYPHVFPWRISALIPITGRYSTLGRQMLFGILAAKKLIPGLEVIVHDTASSPAKTHKIVFEDILGKDKPIAILAPPDKQSLKSIIGKTGSIPLLSVTSAKGIINTNKSVTLFFAQLQRQKRAHELARIAITKGIKNFAIISPKTNYGKELKKHFEKSVISFGGKIVKTISYKTKKPPKRISLKGVNCVFIPDTASRVELIARIMAASGYFAKPLTKNGKKGLLLLSTVEGLSARVLTNSSRYLEGAIFAPGYYSQSPTPLEQPFVNILSSWGVKRVLTFAIDTFNYYKLVHTSLLRGSTSHELFKKSMAKFSAGPGLGSLFDETGKTNRPVRLYTVKKGKTYILTP